MKLKILLIKSGMWPEMLNFPGKGDDVILNLSGTLESPGEL